MGEALDQPSKSEAANHAFHGSELEQRRERLRRRFLRANTAVGVILLAVLGLALASVLAGIRAERNQRRAEAAEQLAREQLWRAYLSQARAARLDEHMGRRTAALAAITEATAIRPSDELRDEAIAALALTDLELELAFTPIPRQHGYCAFLSNLTACVVGDYRGRFEVRRLPDHQKLLDIDATATAIGTNRLLLDCIASKDGRFFATSFKDGAVAIWETAKGQPLFVHVPSKYAAAGMEFTVDGNRFGFTDSDRDGALRIIDLPAGTDHPMARGLQPQAFSFRAGTSQVAVSDRHEIQIVDLETGSVARTLTPPGAIVDLVWSPDGQKLAGITAGDDIYLWLLDTGELRVLRGHSAKLRSAVFSPASDLLMTASLDGETRLWDCILGRELIRTKDGIGMSFSVDGRQIGYFIPGTGVGVWRIVSSASFRTLVGHGGRARSLTAFDLSPNGRWVVLQVDGGFQLWDLNTTKPGQFIPVPDLRSVVLHPSGDSVVLCRGGGIELHGLQPMTNSHDVAVLGTARAAILPPKVTVKQAALSHDGRTAAVELNDLRVVVLDLNGQRAPVFLEGRSQLFFYFGPAGATGSGRLAVSADGRWVAIGYGPSPGPRVWDARTGAVVATLDESGGAAAFSSDGRWLATTSAEGCSLWQVETWRRVWRRPQSGLNGRFTSVAFSGDGASLVSLMDRHSLAVSDTTSQTVLGRLTAPEPQSIDNVRMSADGSRLLAATANNLIQVWDLNVIRRELGLLNLAWSSYPASPQIAPKSNALPVVPSIPALLGLLGASVAAFTALLVLRRHRQLAHEVARTEELAAQRGRELSVERDLHRLKTSFVSMVSHEFRTPLGIIMSSAEILESYFQRLDETRRREHLHDIVDAARRMNDLIGEVLLLGQVDAGRMECCVRTVDLPALCRKVIEDVGTATQQRCPVLLEAEMGRGSPQLDERLVTIILSNLLNNAVKYSSAGEPVHLSTRRDGVDVKIELRDQGIGIPSEDQAELFKTFRRGRNVGDIPGTGLGLTIVKRCVDIHHGNISFISSEHSGTSFTVRLPGFLPED